MRHRYSLPIILILVALLTITPTASAQLCGNTACGEDRHPCWSSDQAFGLIPGNACRAPLGNRTVVAVCLGRGVQAGQACCSCVLGPLACAPMLIDSSTLQIFVHSELGLTSIVPVSAINVNLTTYDFAPGTTSPIQVLASKINVSQPARVELQVCDPSGCINCDPVVTLVVRETGKPVSESFTNVVQAESKVTIYNGSPGLRNLDVTVNGETFKMNGLKPGEERTIDAASVMLPEATNTITLTGTGRPGGEATVMIHD